MKLSYPALIAGLLVLSCCQLTLPALAQQPNKQPEEKVYEPKDVDRRAKILRKSEPQYTEQAKKNHTSGFVLLQVVLKGSGEVGEIKVIRDLPDGLTEECIKAAREIKFEPALKDGNPVSQYLRLQYTFNSD
ncbi:MAG TPA: energy transducer TonB [Pyrinomonadaceae bacterium]|nr:energy transducer TonB [Pyrinomonadaceae bacterium]